MGKIIFTERRKLLDETLVNIGEEGDFGDAENAAFVNNGVAKWAPGFGPVATDEVDHG